MIHPLCLMRSVVNWLRGMLTVGTPIDGHDYISEQRWDNCRVSVLRCERDGKYVVMWQKTARSRYDPYDDEALTDDEIARLTASQESIPSSCEVITRINS